MPADRSSEELGLAPDLSRLPEKARALIRHGNRRSRGDGLASVCTAMFRSGYHIEEVWMIVTSPANRISEEFYAEDGAAAEILLEMTIARAMQETTDE